MQRNTDFHRPPLAIGQVWKTQSGATVEIKCENTDLNLRGAYPWETKNGWTYTADGLYYANCSDARDLRECVYDPCSHSGELSPLAGRVAYQAYVCSHTLVDNASLGRFLRKLAAAMGWASNSTATRDLARVADELDPPAPSLEDARTAARRILLSGMPSGDVKTVVEYIKYIPE